MTEELLIRSILPGVEVQPEFKFAAGDGTCKDDQITIKVFGKLRRWRFDYALPAERVAWEIEGGHWSGGRHTRGDGFEKDIEKYNHATLLGWRVIRSTSSTSSKVKALETIKLLLGKSRADIHSEG